MPPFICWYDHYLTNNISCPHYLEEDQFSRQTPQQIITAANRRIGLYTGYKNMPVGTPAARLLWDQCLDMQINFYQRLKTQMEATLA